MKKKARGMRGRVRTKGAKRQRDREREKKESSMGLFSYPFSVFLTPVLTEQINTSGLYLWSHLLGTWTVLMFYCGQLVVQIALICWSFLVLLENMFFFFFLFSSLTLITWLSISLNVEMLQYMPSFGLEKKKRTFSRQVLNPLFLFSWGFWFLRIYALNKWLPFDLHCREFWEVLS